MSWKNVVFFAALMLLAAIVFGLNVSARSLWEPDEARYAQIASTMVKTGNWLEPSLNYRRHFEKPPFFYWLVALAFKGLGKTDVAARLPVLISAMLLIGILYLFTFSWFKNDALAVYAPLIAASSLGFGLLARIVLPDMVLILTVAFASFLTIAAYRDTKARAHRYGFLIGSTLGICFLIKGPIGMIFIFLSAAIFFYRERRIAEFGRIFNLSFWISFLLVALPWFVILIAKRETLVSYWTNTMVLRFVQGSGYHKEPFYFFVPVIAVAFLPWSIFLPRMCRYYATNAHCREETRFFAIASIVSFIFFSASRGKLPHYILVMVPFLAVLMAGFFSDARRFPKGLFAAEAWIFSLLAGIAIVGGYIAIGHASAKIPLPRALLLKYFVFLAGIVGWTHFARITKNTRLLLAVFCVAGFSWQLLFGFLAPRYEYYAKTVKPLAGTINALAHPAGNIYAYKTAPYGLLFYTDAAYIFVEIPEKKYFFPGGLAQSQEDHYMSESEFVHRIEKGEKIVAVATRGDFSFLQSIVSRKLIVMDETRKYVVFRAS